MTEETQAPATAEEIAQEAETETKAEPAKAQALRGEDGSEQAQVQAEQEIVEGELELVEAADEKPVDELAVLAAELEETRAQAAEYLDGWQRARAEFANFRRRQEQRRKQMDVEAKARVLSNLLPVVDDLERAFEAVPEDMNAHTWVSGLSLVLQKLVKVLEKAGLTVLEVESGDAFDPNLHEALTHEPNADYDGGSIIEVVHRGYKLDETVLRPALVRVSSGKADADQTEEA